MIKTTMRVTHFNLEGRQIKNTKKDTFTNQNLARETIELVMNSIIFYNSNPQAKFDQDKFAPRGTDIEVGLY